MAIGDWLRKAGDAADAAAQSATEALEDVKGRAKDKLSGDKGQVYAQAVNDVENAVQDAGLSTAALATIFEDIREGNPYT